MAEQSSVTHSSECNDGLTYMDGPPYRCEGECDPAGQRHTRRGMGAEDYCTCDGPWPCASAPREAS